MYGFELDEIVISKKGFIALPPPGKGVKKETEYIAPLKADFDTTKGMVEYYEWPLHFSVRWSNMSLASQPRTAGLFSFEVVIYSDGKILFHYLNMPSKPADLRNITIGLADAYRLI